VKSTRGGREQPVLITEAQLSLEAQHNARRRKYAVMMATRVVCLVLAAVFYRVPWLMAILAAAALALPWMAVLIANDRPPKKAVKVNRYAGHPAPDRALPPADGSRVIDS
jgi:Protein of unknown function (DUF3099)